jgi:hypothetical protein
MKNIVVKLGKVIYLVSSESDETKLDYSNILMQKAGGRILSIKYLSFCFSRIWANFEKEVYTEDADEMIEENKEVLEGWRKQLEWKSLFCWDIPWVDICLQRMHSNTQRGKFICNFIIFQEICRKSVNFCLFQIRTFDTVGPVENSETLRL